ncbi:creatininase family protein [uncultured Chloroflexus sp.]|uniref:creatininase family protein n=1 Tax=uncultured Chloroflexus sp. TaxID=214040 RepID=UPI002604AAE4|nr:creatininase family protein [uncultured Chloroflexus sp.]
MSAAQAWGRWVDLLPVQQQQLIAKQPICWLPWATLEPRGSHLPCGVAGYIAEAVTEGAARRVGGVLYPLLWWDSNDNIALFRQLVAARLAAVATQGFQVAIVIGLPETTMIDLALIEAAEAAWSQHQLLTLAISPLELVDETMQDHGALWETSLLLAMHPELVDLSQFAPNDGRNVRDVASPSLGNHALTLAIDRLAKAVQDVYTRRNVAAITALYQQRRARYNRSAL